MAAVTIIGGHGKIALRLARQLSDKGHEVTSWIRKAEQGSDVEETGATPAVFDVETMSTQQMSESFAGADVVVWSAGAGGGSPERTVAVDREAAIRSMDAAVAAGVSRYVMVSYFGAGPDHGVPQDNAFFTYAQAKTDADAHLRDTSLDWTILAPSTLTDDAGTGAIETGDGVTAGHVARDDVATVAAYVIDHADFARTTIQFNNGETPIRLALDAIV
ncbi:SDR family oxidoreductase [Knoellia sp. Soil729]|uniref:SDR family oxidoreductase n=1 Tax=Knoellia sp. Soil729 TaxID=1736394 RepID=UPI0006F59441|nr:SDR family oxidoreductase [Knoellia sp. Soil729]KRE42174.1 NAD-dependent dehydratase [Knoellia sp. Soil729]